MAKVFRLHDGEDGTGWFNSRIFNDDDLKSIRTDGKEVSNSIPSPFARIDLVKEAFRWVSLNGIEGNTAQHRLVSEALDVGQLMFYSNLYKDYLDIIEYKPKHRIEDNFDEISSKHKDLANTLHVYWSEDGNVYNFNESDRIYFVIYNKELIGATSPASVFLSAPIKESLKKEITLTRASGRYFDSIPVSLAEREWDFIEYMYALSKQSIFSERFPEVFEYLEKVKSSVNRDNRRAINELNSDTVSNYTPCHVTGESSNYCNIAGLPLFLAKERVTDIESSSDFLIESDHPIEGKKPLVLPNGVFSDSWTYTTSDVKWNPNDYNGKIPDKNEQPLTESRLPITNDKYPWLTVGNFLEDKIITLPYDIDSSKFVTGKGENGNRYLLPLTETFFEYFDAGNAADMLSIEQLSQGTVFVTLNIKTRRGEIKLEKTYKNDAQIALELHVAILPFIKVEENIPAKYNIGIIDGDIFNNHKNKITATCFSKGRHVETSESIIRAPGKQNTIKSFYLSTNRFFDSMKLTFNTEVSGFLIPNMNEYQPGYEKCKFAVDFGTTNTHIEYKIEDNAEKALDNLISEPFWTTLMDRATDVDPVYQVNERTFETEMFPYSFGDEESLVKFPLRTAMVENDIDFNQPIEIFKHLNNYLMYEKRDLPGYLNLNTTLKWEDLDDSRNRVRLEAYIENLAWLIYYKGLSLNIDLSNIKIIWFYPTSMGKFQRGLMEDAWRGNLKEIFGSDFNDKNLKSIPESIGPYIYYYEIEGISGQSVSVDIGGGSTDISIYDQNQTKLISSIRFAGDAIFGDGYGANPNKNGFVNLVKNQAYTYLKSNDISTGILDTILETRRMSNDFSSYLFALSETSGKSFDYSSIIKIDPNIKLVILLFHGALAYYIGKLLELAGYKNPKQLLFSGSASKTVSLLDSSSSLESISGLYEYIFYRLNVDGKSATLKCNLSNIPKEITCKGGLLSENVNIEGYKQYFWLGGEGDWDKCIDLENLSNIPKYGSINDDNEERISKSIHNFYDLMDDYAEKVDLENEFGISRSAYKVFRKQRAKEIKDDLGRGILQTLKEQHENDKEPIDQSLFFYPLIGEINRIAYKLSKLSKNND